jgi:hypothetical protein
MGPGFKFLGIKLDSFEANWILEMEPALNPSLNLGSPKLELSFEHFFWKLENWLIFPAKWCLCRFSHNLPQFCLGPSSKGHESNLWLSAIRNSLFHRTLDLRPSSKMTLSLVGFHHISQELGIFWFFEFFGWFLDDEAHILMRIYYDSH